MQVGWLIGGQRYTHTEAIALARTYPENLDYDENMLSQMWQGDGQRTYVSPTMLAGCARQEVLKRTVDYWLEPDKVWALLRGTLGHLIMERGKHEAGAVLEQKLHITIQLPDGHSYMLAGQPDKVVPAERLLIDYKTVQELEATPKSYWVAQLSCYRWMLHQYGIPIDRAIIQQIGMKRPRRLYINLWSLEHTERYLIEKVPRFSGVFDGTFTLEKLPDPLNWALDEGAWMCFPAGKTGIWCPVAAECKARLRGGGG